MDKLGALIINEIVIEKETIEEEWKLFKKKILGDAELNLYPQEQQDEMNRKTLEYVKKNIIERTLLELEAIKYIGDIPYQEIKDYYQKIVKHFGGLDAFSKKFGVSPDSTNPHMTQKEVNIPAFEIQENIEKSLKVDKLIESWEQDLPELVEEDIEAFYEKNKHLYPAKDRIMVTLIEGVRKKEENDIDWFATEEQLLELLDFYKEKMERVGEVSLSPSSLIEEITHKAQTMERLWVREHVVFEQGTLEPEVEKYLFDMNDQVLSGIVRAKDNLHLFWKSKMLDAGVWDFKHVRDSVKKDTVVARRNNCIREKLVKLREAATIEDYFTGSEPASNGKS